MLGKIHQSWFFGFKLHVIIDIEGRILQAMMLPANRDDRDAARVLASAVDGGIGLATSAPAAARSRTNWPKSSIC